MTILSGNGNEEEHVGCEDLRIEDYLTDSDAWYLKECRCLPDLDYKCSFCRVQKLVEGDW